MDGDVKCSIDAEPTWTLLELKKAIRAAEGTPEMYQKLVRGTTELVSNSLLSEALGVRDNVATEVSITLVKVATKQVSDVLVLKFLLPDGSKRTIDVTGVEPPLGIDLSKAPPTRTVGVAVGSHAERFGVQTGWNLEYVNEDFVGSEVNTKSIFEMIKAQLPAAR